MFKGKILKAPQFKQIGNQQKEEGRYISKSLKEIIIDVYYVKVKIKIFLILTTRFLSE